MPHSALTKKSSALTISASRLAWLIGLVTPLQLIFEPILFGQNIPMALFLYLPLILFVRTESLSPLLIILPLLLILVIKVFVGGDIASILQRAFLSFSAVLAMSSKYANKLTAGFQASIYLSLSIGFIQWLSIIITPQSLAIWDQFGATISGGRAFHIFMNGSILPTPRVPAFTFEPAYLGIFVSCFFILRLLSGIPFRKDILVILIISLLIVNSRTSTISILLTFGIYWLGSKGNNWGAFTLALTSVSAVIAFFLYSLTADMNTLNADRDYSFFARAFPLYVFFSENVGTVGKLLGVINYESLMVENYSNSIYSGMLIATNAISNPKSLLGSFFFDYGVIGTIWALIIPPFILQLNLVRMSAWFTLPLIFFNVAAPSWPIFWLLYGLILSKRITTK